jgi:hypothetical protein
MRSSVPSKAPHSGSWASVVSAPAGSVAASGVVLQSTLVSQLEDCLERVGSFLERAEAALGRLSLMPAMLKTTSMSCPPGEVGASSMEGGRVELYGCFSPRVGDASSLLFVPSTVEGKAIIEVVDPVLQIMPEL